MPEALPLAAVSAAETIAAIRAQLARPEPPSIDPVMQPLVYGAVAEEVYRLVLRMV